jgi:benzylsuccinate CoA-transferase BbsF subunit
VRNALAGLRVLDFCWVGAGALVTKLLAEHGAEVIKIESHARPDNLRVAPPFVQSDQNLERSGYFASRNNDKKSFALNMQLPRSRELALQLAASSDLVTNNFRPGIMERWGLSYEAIREINPRVIYLSMPMQGSDGPHSAYVGFGSTIAALAGLVHLSGRPDRAPVGTGTHYPDHIPSPGHALVAVLAAIRQRNRTGEGRMIELSQLEATVNMIAPAIARAAVGDEGVERSGNRIAAHSPSGAFQCKGDDAWCAISVRSDDEWRSLAAELGRPELACDARFASTADRKANEDALEALLIPLIRERARGELADALQARGVPASAVMSSEDLFEDGHLAARGFWRKVQHPVMGELTAPAAPFLVDGLRTGPERAAPLLGEHTRELGKSVLGLTDEEIDSLEQEKVLW